jgi:hypothetical protein
MIFQLSCLECKNDIDLTKYTDLLDKLYKGELEKENEIIIECNHCATDHLVISIDKNGKIKAEIIERDK